MASTTSFKKRRVQEMPQLPSLAPWAGPGSHHTVAARAQLQGQPGGDALVKMIGEKNTTLQE